ncbi:S2-RNase [Pyrus ussuriensis x Pyrus communis]|uniref:S2-RNase n=1 Tax=Pyrus ussuriensis x Pyrus communis TaxID=2448454 RepID=A0A5N5HI37_9ROSA|nr:S2-RNase [Pyrus ussuriensis x Pyrus communis]
MKISVSGETFIPATESKSGRKMVNFSHKAGGCLKLPGVDSSSTVVQRGQVWLGFSPGMMGYKAQVVASTITLPIFRKIKKRARSTVRTANFRGLKPPHTVVNQGGSWVAFVEGNESFKMVVVASKNSIGVGWNRPWKMGGHTCRARPIVTFHDSNARVRLTLLIYRKKKHTKEKKRLKKKLKNCVFCYSMNLVNEEKGRSAREKRKERSA